MTKLRKAQKGDVIKLEATGKEYKVVDRHYECGMEDNGIEFVDEDGVVFCEYDGAYTIVRSRFQLKGN